MPASRLAREKNPFEQAIEALPLDFRMVVLLADVEGFAYKEIADILGIPRGTVMSRSFRRWSAPPALTLGAKRKPLGISKAREG